MRIGIDMLATQSPGSRLRGIGRLGRSLAERLPAIDPQWEYIFYLHAGLPEDLVPASPNARRRVLRKETERRERNLEEVLNRLARENPDELDVLLILSPFEMHDDYGPPLRPFNGLKTVAVVHDLIPFRHQERYLTNPTSARRFYRNLERLRGYDLLLANSDATLEDFRRMLALPEHRLTAIGAAADSTFPESRSDDRDLSDRRILKKLGILQSFVYSVTNVDYHKNLPGLIDAFALLPARLRATYQLVIVCGVLDAGQAQWLRDAARSRGIDDRLVLAEGVSDETLRVLYRDCAVFCLPSLHEGFGLPILEAMRFGAPVVAGNNSSQIEVVGDAGILANVADAADLSSRLERVLSDPDLADSLRRKARERSTLFSWDNVARRTVDALKSLRTTSPRFGGKELRYDGPHTKSKSRLAVFSPLPPCPSGIGNYTLRLLQELKRYYLVDLFHDSNYIPDLALAAGEFACRDYRLFDRMRRAVEYRDALYHMGNSVYHKFIFDTMLRHPGTTVLHDFCLSGFQWWYSHLHGVDPDHFRNEVRRFEPERSEEILASLDELKREPGSIQDAFAKRGLFVNSSVFDRSRSVIVHSDWALDKVRHRFPEHVRRTSLIPLGAEPRIRDVIKRRAVRDKLGFDDETVVFTSLGFITRGKLSVEAVEAFASTAKAIPRAIFLFVGQDLENGEARSKAIELGIADRVRFLGRKSDEEFAEFVSATDVGIGLRRPPTYGESSASLLDLLRAGVASIVVDVGTFADFPDSAVRKIPWNENFTAELSAAMLDLARNRNERDRLGREAFRHVLDRHDWSKVAEAYVETMERGYALSKRNKRFSYGFSREGVGL